MKDRKVSARDLQRGMTIMDEGGKKSSRYRVLDAVLRNMGSEMHVSVRDPGGDVRLWRYSAIASVTVR